MSVATVTSKGQITIPSPVRKHLHLNVGDKVDFRVEADGSVRMLPLSRSVADVFGILAKTAESPVSVEDMDAGIRRTLRRKSR